MVVKSPVRFDPDTEEVDVKKEPLSPSDSPLHAELESGKRKRHDSDQDSGEKKKKKRRKHKEKKEKKRKRHDSTEKDDENSKREKKKKRSRRHDEEGSGDKRHRRDISDGELFDRSQREEKDDDEEAALAEYMAKKRQSEQLESLKTKAGGAYIPPAKLRQMQQQITDKGSEHYQRLEWERLKKRIHGHVNKVNVGNLVDVVRELLQENIVRGKGLLARSIIQAQAFSPTFSHVYAALVSVINSKFPHIGELILRRLIIQFKRSYKRNDKQTTVTVTKFLSHLINQQVAHEVLALEILTLLLETPTDDSVEVAVACLRECGSKLSEVSPRGINAIFDRLRSILQESKNLDKRVQYMIEVIFSVRKDKFSANPSVVGELDLVEEDDQITHTITLEDAQDPENVLNVFRLDPEFEKSEEMYEEIKKEILGEDSDEEEEEEDSEGSDEEGNDKKMVILDNTETNLVAFRRIVYLTIQSSLDYQEAAHKLMKLEIKPGMESEMSHMILDCCAQQRTYEKFYGLLAERFCRLRKEFQENFQQIFKDTYETIHRFEITKLRNSTKLLAHLLFTDAISWEVLSVIKLNEDDRVVHS